MLDKTFGLTGEDVRKLESKNGKHMVERFPAIQTWQSSRYVASSLIRDHFTITVVLNDHEQQIIAENTDPDRIDKVKANIPPPEDPLNGKAPPPDINSSDACTVNIGSGGVNAKLGIGSANGLREPATAESSARIDDQEWHKPTEPRAVVVCI